ncbi:MAG TPA: HD domain-containing protein [Caulobacteraceae bacterium]|nr:HD domain-containing protein [Caulobacteraceae bacterium]
MTKLSSLKDVARLYAERGGLKYGEDVTQLQHALQCATLAEEAGSAPSLIVAALLHDIAHLFVSEAEATETDDRHQEVGAQALSTLFGEAVTQPVALHVAAKRYLCFKEAGYWESLSAASKASLELQGGPFGADQAAAFEQQPYWREALVLRRYDDTGKREDADARDFADFAPLTARLAKT